MRDKSVRSLRLQMGLSQERFAQLLGVSLQTIRRWEGGLSTPLPIIRQRLEELQRQANTAEQKGGNATMSSKGKMPRESIEIGMGGLFKGIGSLLDLVSRMAEEGKEEYRQSGEVAVLGGKAKGVYGFSVKLGLGGKPVIESFGNIKATEEGAVVAEVREPLVDVLDEEERVVVVAELPGVEEKSIHIEVREDMLELAAEARDRKYHKEVLLPSPVNASTMESSYRNGVLEIRLTKKK
ncbi:MAG: archaeal heat shock protein Hsp20 [Chloroflexota bacterium]|nr:archaeal heat shock protein Hsp20 [Chloroflexota bacterium]